MAKCRDRVKPMQMQMQILPCFALQSEGGKFLFYLIYSFGPYGSTQMLLFLFIFFLLLFILKKNTHKN
jgi:hypothetical protein